MSDKITNIAIKAEQEHRNAIESAADYIENFDILETITNVGNDEVFTPRKTCDMMLDSLPEEVWHNPNYKWLNPATKNGVFEREIAIRLDAGLKDVIPDTEQRRKHILQNMIFAIGQTKFTAHVARRTLYYCSQANRKCDCIIAEDGHYVNGYAIGNGSWFDDEEGNIKTPCTNHEFFNTAGKAMPSNCKQEDKGKYKCKYCGISGDSKYNDANQRETYAYEFIHVNHLALEKHLQKRFFGGNKDMKFDIIIGNPPYQLSTGGAQAQATPIYHKFILQSIALSPKYISMIVPSRWFTGGFGLDSFREIMLKDRRIKQIDDFFNASDCFSNVEIKGGVNFFLWDRDYNGACLINSHKNGVIESSSKRLLLEKGQDVFIRYNGAISILKKIASFKEKTIDTAMSSQRPFGLPTNFNSYSDDCSGIKIYANKKIGYIKDASLITKNKELIKKWKILTPKAIGTGDGLEDLVKPIVAEPNSACTETYVVFGVYGNKQEALNACSYINTQFFHFLLTLRKNTQDALAKVYSFIPLQDFRETWNDKKLYQKYGITEKEILFIKSMTREMN